MAVLDQDVGARYAIHFPFLFTDGLLKRRLNTHTLLLWLGSALWEAAVLFFFLRFISQYASYSATTPYVFEMGTYLIFAILLTVNLRLVMVTNRHDWIFILSIIGSLALVPICAWLFDALNFDDMRGGMRYVFGSPAMWLYLILAIAVCQAPFGLYQFWKRNSLPQYRDLVQEYQLLIQPSLDDGRRRSAYQQVCTCYMRRQKNSQLPDAAQLLEIVQGKRPPLPERPVRTAVRVRPSEIHDVIGAIPEGAQVPSSQTASATAPQQGEAAGSRGETTGEVARLRPRKGPLQGRGGVATSATALQPLSFIQHPPNPRRSLRHRRDWNTLPYPSDVEADL